MNSRYKALLARLGAAFGRHAWILVPLLSLPALVPFFTFGLLTSDDGTNHLLRSYSLGQQLLEGLLYPRWSSDLALGYGYPLLNFYGPAAYYLMLAFHALGSYYPVAFELTLAALVLVAGLGMWRLAGDVLTDASGAVGLWPPLVAATAYMYAPYVLTNVYLRSAVAELMAQALLPWILWAFRKLMIGGADGRYFGLAAGGLALLVATHTISILLVPIFLLAYLGLGLRRRSSPIKPVITAGLAAVALSAFFWLPVVVERSDLAPNSLEHGRVLLEQSFLTWRTLIDGSLTYRYVIAQTPPRLGLAQVILALAGFALAGRRTREWWFLGVSAVLLSLLMTSATQALWLSVNEAAIIQFPWRLLGLASVPLALLTAGSLAPLNRRGWRALAAVPLMGLIVYANAPRVNQILPTPDDGGLLSPAYIAQYESISDHIGLSANDQQVNSDFTPRWVDLRAGLRGVPPQGDNLPTQGVDVTLQAADAYEWQLQVSSQQPAVLRFTSFYFPGWRAWLDGRTETPLYPSTVMGLLTVSVPAGSHTLRVAWDGTPLEGWATALSLLALAALSLWAWLKAGARVTALLLGAGVLLGFWAAVARPTAVAVAQPPAAVTTAGLQLLGLRTELRQPFLDLYPDWYVRATPADVALDWQLLSPKGAVLSEAQSRPYFDTLPAFSWRTGTVVDDAYRLALPPNLTAGTYTLRVCALPARMAAPCPSFVNAGTVALPATGPAAPPPPYANPLNLKVNDELQLGSWAVTSDQGPLPTDGGRSAVALAGQRIYYTFYWRGLRPVPENYHGFVHLVDNHLNKVAALDQALGPAYYPPRLWDTFYWKPDVYALTIPPDTPSGLYQPLAGVYRSETHAGLPITTMAGTGLPGGIPLPPIKVLRPNSARPAQAVRAQFTGLGTLLGYDLAPSDLTLRPGDWLTLTLYYRSAGSSAPDETQFVHLDDPRLGLAAQSDSAPQDGLNPTSAWLTGETVVSTTKLQVAPDAAPGAYALDVGFYDPAAGDQRLAAQDAQQQALENDEVVLAHVTVAEPTPR